MKTKEFLIILGLSLIVTYFICIHKYTHKVVLQEKYVEEPEYRLYRRKQSDLVLTWEEYQSLKINNPEAVYISEKLYFFVLDGERTNVNKETYDKYIEGAKVRYLKTFMFWEKEIQ